MGFYPLSLDLEGRRCVVVGGGGVAERRIEALLRAGALVSVVSPTLTPALAELVAAGRVRHVARAYTAGDLTGATLAFTATDDPAVAPAVAREARERGVWLNAADDPTHCDFILPGLVRRGVLSVAVTSGGASPALTRALREHLDEAVGAEWTALGELAAAARRELRQAGRAVDAETWRRALAADVRALLAEGRPQDARGRLRERLDLSP
jgi:precorrin-2 dehydrogenase / sirohydrochlorin ferrochelatase